MKPNYKRPFVHYIKKAHKPLQLAIEDAVELVCDSPDIGELKVGDQFQTGPDRHAPVVTVRALEGDAVLLDANHPLAGEELHFEVELITARPATPEELPAATNLT